MARNGRIMWRKMAQNDGFCRVNALSIMAFLSALCDLCGKIFVTDFVVVWRGEYPLYLPLLKFDAMAGQ